MTHAPVPPRVPGVLMPLFGWLAGTLMAAPLSIPLVNLLVPVLGVATFTHLFHRLAERAR